MQRETLARVDDLSRRNHIASAHEVIYEKSYAVDSKAMEDLLKVDSLVPTAVRDRSVILCISDVMIFRSRTHFQANWHSLGFACTPCSSWILCTSSSSASGKRSLSISYVFWTAKLRVSNMN